MQDKWTDQLRDTLSGYEVTPPEGLWESLAEALPASSASGRQVASKPVAPVIRRRHRWIAMAAAAALLLSLGSAGWILFQDNDLTPSAGIQLTTSDVRDTMTPEASSTPAIPFMQTRSNRGPNAVRKSDKPRATELTSTQNPSSQLPSSLAIPETRIPSARTMALLDTISGHSASTRDVIAPDDTVAITSVSDHADSQTFALMDKNEYDWRSETSRSSRRNAGKSMHGVSLGVMTAYAGGHSTISSDYVLNGPINSDPMPPGDNANSSQPDPPSTEEITETHYDLPVRVGVTVQFPMADRLGLETGLMYTYLSSEQSGQVTDRLTRSRYRLHYLGIPLSVKYRIASWQAVDVYASAGIALEKCVSGSVYTTTDTPYSHTQSQSETPAHPWHWSLSVGAGIQYRPLPAVGIYLEPTLAWYPSSGTTLPVIYADRPLDFRLTLGLRFLLPR